MQDVNKAYIEDCGNYFTGFQFDEDLLNDDAPYKDKTELKTWCISSIDSQFDDIMNQLKYNNIVRKLTIESALLGVNAFSALTKMLACNKYIKSILIQPSMRGVSAEILSKFCDALKSNDVLECLDISLSYVTGINITNATDISIPNMLKAIADMLHANNTLRHLKLCIEQPIVVGKKQDVGEIFPMIKDAIKRDDSNLVTLELSYTWYNHKSDSDKMNLHIIMDQEIKDLLLANEEKSDFYYR